MNSRFSSRLVLLSPDIFRPPSTASAHFARRTAVMASRLQSLDATTAVKRARSAEQSKSGTPTVENSFDFEDAPLPPFLRLDHEGMLRAQHCRAGAFR